MRDVAYFMGSCLSADECQLHVDELLSHYFKNLRGQLSNRLSPQDISSLEVEWRSLYAIAWTDFYRFLLGWMPSHNKIHAYTLALSNIALQQLQSEV